MRGKAASRAAAVPAGRPAGTALLDLRAGQLGVRVVGGARAIDDLLQRLDVHQERGRGRTLLSRADVRGRLPTNDLRISTYPAASSAVSCLDRAESERPSSSRMNLKSAHSAAASSETILSLVGAWISSSNFALAHSLAPARLASIVLRNQRERNGPVASIATPPMTVAIVAGADVPAARSAKPRRVSIRRSARRSRRWPVRREGRAGRCCARGRGRARRRSSRRSARRGPPPRTGWTRRGQRGSSVSTAAPMANIAAATTHQYQTGTVAESMSCC